MTVNLTEFLEGEYPDEEWREACLRTHPHLLTVLGGRWMEQHIVLEVVLRGTVEVNILDHGERAFLHRDERTPEEDDADFRNQVRDMVDEALLAWYG